MIYVVEKSCFESAVPPVPATSAVARIFSATRPQPACAKATVSAKSFEESRHQGVEIAVLFSELLDLADRVDDGRMVLAAEAAADLGQRRPRQRLAEIHRNLARHRDRLRVVPRLQIDE